MRQELVGARPSKAEVSSPVNVSSHRLILLKSLSKGERGSLPVENRRRSRRIMISVIFVVFCHVSSC